ncbi:MAG: hypothetical protein ACR652_00990 [Methylocystis sp.]|uniref:hypothetical protein n=1 Tax=Methylocystis sp. TaxID=1911079 RepID=UPI003DA25202
MSIYETGLLQSLVTHSYAATLSGPGGAERVAAAIRNGARCRADPLLGVDYFSMADQPLDSLRDTSGIVAGG